MRASSDTSTTDDAAAGMRDALLYVDALAAFDRVVTACFGKKLVYGWRKCIQEFETLYKKSGASVTPKAHVVFRHVIEFCDHFGFGLGYYSEQPFESVHQDWKQIWEHMKVHDASNPRLLERLLLSLQLYNIRHF